MVASCGSGLDQLTKHYIHQASKVNNTFCNAQHSSCGYPAGVYQPFAKAMSDFSVIGNPLVAKSSNKTATLGNFTTPTALSTSDRVTKTSTSTQPVNTVDESSGAADSEGGSGPPNTGAAIALSALYGKVEMLLLSLLLVGGGVVLLL
jgi:hypothetical protein